MLVLWVILLKWQGFEIGPSKVLRKKYSLLEICSHECNTLRLLLLAGTNFSVLVVGCIWQVLILAFL